VLDEVSNAVEFLRDIRASCFISSLRCLVTLLFVVTGTCR